MKFLNRVNVIQALAIVGLIGTTIQANARPNVSTHGPKSGLKTTATGCQPAKAAIDLDINNVRARLMTGGDMWWNLGTQVAAYEIPKGSGKSSQFAASCWIGGFDAQKQLKVAAQTYRQDGNDYWPGVLGAGGNPPGKIDINVCNAWDQFFRVYKSDITQFIAMYKSGGSGAVEKDPQFQSIMQWPGSGNDLAVSAVSASDRLPMVAGNSYAPFVDINGDGIYEPKQGEYPDIRGDELIWWVFNDAGNVKGQTQTAAIGVEVQTSAFAYATQDFLNDATFCQYRVYNRGALTMDSTYIAVWDDADLGYYYDDYIGCDTTRGLGIEYNGTNCDGCSAGYPVNSYGTNPPQTGLDFFQGPTKKLPNGTTKTLSMTNFTYYNNDFTAIGNPVNGVEIYNYMTGSIRDGEKFTDDFQGPGVQSKGYGSGKPSNYVYWSDPSDNSGWSECNCLNVPGDRRFVFSSGPFQLLPGAKNDIIFGCVWAAGVGGCPNTSFKTITAIDDQAQALFESGFKTVEGPQAPRLVVKELDRKLVFYIVNDYGSNNYRENYGRNDSVSPTVNYADSLQYHQTVLKAKTTGSTDTLYHFEGYRVFQVANSTVTPADIFNSNTGEVDPTKAAEVFQCDIHNGVTRIVNYALAPSVSDTTWVPQVKVNGKDSGIVHSFELTQDQFSTSNDKTIVNYHNYYYVAIAYAYNDFSYNATTHSGGFNSHNSSSTQDVPYISSAHGANFIPIPVVVAMPDPTSGAVSEVLQSGYGSGVAIHRIEGQGNGGIALHLDQASEDLALQNNIAAEAVYQQGAGPVDVKVIDPVKVPALNWELYINGSYHGGTSGYDKADVGIDGADGSWTLIAKDPAGNDTIYSEANIGTANEQIIEKYGLSVTVNQVGRPGDDPRGVNSRFLNGYITSNLIFTDPTKPWLQGVPDGADSNVLNWIRSGGNGTASTNPPDPCNFNDNVVVSPSSYGYVDPLQAYEGLLPNYTQAKSTWAPYYLTAPFNGAVKAGVSPGSCPFTASFSSTYTQALYSLYSVDIVFTSDKSKWSRCAVIEMQEDNTVSQGGASKFDLRRHASWNLDFDNSGVPTYSTDENDTSMSWFPGYAINEETGERLNVVFGEDSWQKTENGADMLWNPTSNIINPYDGSVLFGGKHYVYILNTRYDGDSAFRHVLDSGARGSIGTRAASYRAAYKNMQWVGMPIVNSEVPLLSAANGFIPTETRIQFRVTRPYAAFEGVDTTSTGYAFNNPKTYPFYTFSTSDLAPVAASDKGVSNKDLLNKINIVPNPYYGYSGYEANRYDTKVRITHLPTSATVSIYTLDGVLIRTLTKNDPNTSYIDWDIRNTAGLYVASGMYLVDVKAEGIGETVLRWFGAMRPIDISTY